MADESWSDDEDKPKAPVKKVDMSKTRDGFFSGLKDPESAKNVSAGGHISDAIRSEEGSLKDEKSSKPWYGSKDAPDKKGGVGYNPAVIKKENKAEKK